MSSFLSIESKKTDKVDFMKPITNYIKSSYSKEIAEFHKPSILELNNFRENIRLDNDKTENARTKLLQYYNLLCSIEKRIPISESGGVKINFYWYDSLTKKRCSQYSIQYEKQCVLFNIAALESQIGSGYDKTTDDGIKQSAKYYQLAAGTLQHLKDILQGEVVGTPDFTQNFFTIAINVMLAQGQECTYEKAVKGGLNDASLCKLASQVHLYYEQVWGLIISPEFKNFLANVWIPTIQIKVSYYRALSYFHMSNVVFKEDKYGEQVSWLQKAYHQMADVNIQKIVKNVPSMRDIFAQKYPMIVNALKSAENDNNKIYHEHVPAQLPSLTGKSIVKASPFTPLPGDYEPFKGLIPLEIKQSLSIYDEKKAQLIRSEIDSIDDANDIAKSSLSSMNLPGSLQALENPGGIPEDIMRKVQQFRNDGAVSRTLELAITLDQLADQSAILLRTIDEVLDREEAEDTQIRSQLKEKWTRSPSHALTSAIRQEINKFKGNLDHARKSDALIRNKFKDAEDLLAKLANNDISTIIPKGETVIVNSQIVDQLKFLLRDLDQLIEARNALTLELRTLHSKDDISVSLLNAQVPADAIFQEELKKYNPIISKLKINLQEQERLLGAIGDAHQQFVRSKSQNSNSLMARDIAIQQIHVALTTNIEVLQNLSMGINFYTGFQEILNKLKRRSEEFASERARDKQDLLSKLSQASQQQSQYQPQQSQYQPQQQSYQPQVQYSQVQYQPQIQPQFQSQYPPQYSQKPQSATPVYQNMPPQSPSSGSQAQYVVVQGPNGQQQLFPASSLPKWN